MLASRILGKKAYGLSFLLQEFFSVRVNKEFQRANWGKRPISSEMLKYAIMDSHFLIQLRNLIKLELIESNLFELAKEDFLRTSNVVAFQNNQNGNNYWRLLKGNKITPQEMAVFVELCNLRDRLAEKANIPAFKIFATNLILDISKIQPKNEKELSKINGFSEKLSQKYASLIIDAVYLGMKNDPVFKPHKSKPDDQYICLYDALKIWRKKIGLKLKVESDVILPKEFIDKIANNNPKNLEELKTIMIEIPYRFTNFGEGIMTTLDKALRG
jgi:ribonuclease D